MKYKRYNIPESMILKESNLIRQANQKSAIFVTIGIFQIKGLNFKFLPWMSWCLCSNDVYEP